jgi:hypothetical protein
VHHARRPLTKQDRHQQEDVRASKRLDPPPPSALARTQAASVGKPTLAAVHSSRVSFVRTLLSFTNPPGYTRPRR